MKRRCLRATENKVLTIPNILSFFRIALIPMFVWQYCIERNSTLTGYLLILSGLTDAVDGFIARRFDMVSNVGKVLDPLADKLTQGVMLICLLVRFPLMLAPLILLVIKETYMTITGYIIIKRKGIVLGAQWHGKAATCLLYISMFLHVLWSDLPATLSNVTVGACLGMILLSFALYARRNMTTLKEKNDDCAA